MQKPARKQGRNIQLERYALADARASASLTSELLQRSKYTCESPLLVLRKTE